MWLGHAWMRSSWSAGRPIRGRPQIDRESVMTATDLISGVSLRTRLGWIAVTVVIAAVAAVVSHSPGPRVPEEPLRMAPAVGMPGAPPTSAEGLRQRIGDMEERLRERPQDHGAAVLLADALLRQARVTGDARMTSRAGETLRSVLKDTPGQYDALRLLGAVLLSQHRFDEALDAARRARNLRPGDAWNYGVIGDALIELGEYDEAFDALDTMMSMRPSAAAYARVAYARELQGDLHGALQAMQMAAEATTPHDPEALAWYASQVGELHLRLTQFDDADREYRRAAFIFPDHPAAMIGRGKVRAVLGDRDGALAIYLDQFTRAPTSDIAARIGDLHAERGNSAEAERYYQLAEDLAGPGIAQTEAHLALFLAEHDRKLPEAVKIAEAVATRRHDIFTDDARAWAYYKTGRLEDALAASQRALRTGTRDERIVSHAAAIREAARRECPRCGVSRPGHAGGG
jgi:tetratricopeptide (TPR) repeat protein